MLEFLNNLDSVHVCMQLSGKKILASDSDVTSEEQEEGDAASENNNVVGLIQVYCAFLRLHLACISDGWTRVMAKQANHRR